LGTVWERLAAGRHRPAQHRGKPYEQLGEVEKARGQYACFVDAWSDADPELQAWVERGRARLRALTARRE